MPNASKVTWRLPVIAGITAVVLAVGCVGVVSLLNSGRQDPGPAASTPSAGGEPGGSTPSPVRTPTLRPTPTATTPAPVDPGGTDRGGAESESGESPPNDSDDSLVAPSEPLPDLRGVDIPDDDDPIGAGPVLPPGSTRSIFDDAGNLRMPMPQLTHETTVTREADGSAVVTVGFGFDVANRESRTGVRQDRAIIHVMVNDKLSAGGGPLRSVTPLFSQMLIESSLDAAHIERDYTVRLPADVVAFLDSKGFASTDPAARRAALVYVDLDVQHMRDFKRVDGEWDWQQGRAWTAADLPVRVSENTDSSSITMTNATGDGVYRTDMKGPDTALGEGSNVVSGDVALEMSPVLIESTDKYAAPLSLSGQAVQCIAQGNGSNPQGFALMNGWDIEDALAPGTIPSGASVTQTVVADDSLGAPTEAIIEDTGTAAVQATAAALNYTTPGVKSGVQYAYMAAMDLTELSADMTVALGVPVKAIVELAHAIYDAATDSCADFANIVNLTAVEPSGAQSSVSWADQTDGLFNVYDSATNHGNPVIDAVQLARSTGMMTGVVDGTPYAVNPYLSQFPKTACGDAASCVNNEIEVQWSVNSPCPQDDLADCMPQAADIASPELTVPGTSLCGVDNELCPTVASPISSASDVPVQSDLAGTEGSPYSVLKQDLLEVPITAMAVDDEGLLYTGYAEGVVNISTPLGVTEELGELAGGITAMENIDGLIYVGDDSGQLWIYDPVADSLVLGGGFTDGDYITEFVATGGGTVYYATQDHNLYYYPAYDPDHPSIGVGNQVASAPTWPETSGALADQPLTSLASDGSVLFVGFGNGYVTKCELTACGATMQVWVDPRTLPNYLENGAIGVFSAQALELVGDRLYLGGSDASLWQIDADTGAVTAIQTAGTRDAQIAGLALADGALYVGGCISVEDPITSDLLGVFTLDSLDTDPYSFGLPYGNSENYTDVCENPSSTTSDFTGFDGASYQIVVSKPDPSLPAIVYVAFSMTSGGFLYALQNTSEPTVGICTSNCPPETQLASYDTETTTTPSPPVANLAALGSPDILNSCGTTSGYGTTDTGPVVTAGESAVTITDGIQIVAAGSATSECTSQFTWRLGDVGTLPYAFWTADAYPDEDSADADSAGAASWGLTAAAGWDTASVPLPSSTPAYSRVFAPEYLTDTADSYFSPYQFPIMDEITPDGGIVLSPPPLTRISESGTPMIVPLTGRGLLVLTVTVPAGSDPAIIDFAEETLTAVGGNPVTRSPTDVCTPFDLSSLGPEALVYPLDDTSAIAMDATGNGINGIISFPGEMNVQPGPAASCPDAGSLTFAGTTSVDAGTLTDTLVNGRSLSVMTWFQQPVVTGNVTENARLIANDHTDVTGNGFQLVLNGYTGDEAMSGFFDIGTPDGIVSVPWTHVLTSGEWHQYAGVYDGTTVTVYIDGVAVGSAPASGTLLPGGWDVAIGYDPAYDSDFFRGQLANVVIAANPLSAETISSIYEEVMSQ